MLIQALARRAGTYLGSRAARRAPPRAAALSTATPAAPPPDARALADVQALFAESLLLLADAEESRDTTYFADDFADAAASVSATLAAYDALVAGLPPADARAVREANGPKFRQLAEQFAALEHALIHDD
jgi:hypothetical protein